MIDSTPRFLQGVVPFQGAGMSAPVAVEQLTYRVPFDKRSQLIYLRAGNSSEELICLVLLRDGTPMRYFPIGAKAAYHVPLAVTEDLTPETRLALQVLAPDGCSGVLVVDIGLMEI